jgi:cold shock CspA family protein
MPKGHVSRVLPEHGFGFLVDDAGMDWFFVRDGVRGGAFEQLLKDDRVGFSPEWTPKGPRAIDIHLEPAD